jgi:1,4-alpha-glucan branching enzyme
MGRHIRELYRAMAERDDVDIDLVTLGPDEPGPYLGYMKHTADKFVCYKPPFPGMSALLISDIQMLKTVLRLYAEGKRWDVVHVHEWNSLQVARAVRDALDLPLVGTMHLCLTKLAMMDECPTDSAKKEKDGPTPEDSVYLMNQEGRLIVESDRTILCSQAYAEMAREIFLTDREFDVIYNGIRTDEWCPGAGDPDRAAEKHDLNGRPVALFVGRIADMKGIRPLLEAIEDGDTGYQVVLAGEVNANSEEDRESWDVTKWIRRIVEEHPDRLRWIGFQFDQDLLDLYSAAEICLMPSVHEPFGIVALEAMAMGVPLITTEVDGLGEIVKDEDGTEYTLIINPNSAEQLGTAMALLRRNPEARNELRELGLSRARDFDWHVAADKTVAVYRSLLEGR